MAKYRSVAQNQDEYNKRYDTLVKNAEMIITFLNCVSQGEHKAKSESIRDIFIEGLQAVIVQRVGKKVKEAVYITPKKNNHQFEIYRSECITGIRHMMGKLKGYERYKIKGEYFEEENILVFNFKNAVKFESGVFLNNKQVIFKMY